MMITCLSHDDDRLSFPISSSGSLVAGQDLEDPVVSEIELETFPKASASTSATNHPIDRSHSSDEEATCRICLDELSEAEETLRMDCACRGQISLVHRQCALKWFSLKGNNNCEVCNQTIENIPLDLLTISRRNPTANQHQDEVAATWGALHVWQVPVLIFISIMAYFYFFQKILVAAMGEDSVDVSIVFAFIVGCFSVMTSTLMARGILVWLYAILQFAFVVISTIILRPKVKYFDTQPLLTIVSATLIGFGVAFCCGFIVRGALRLKTWLQQHQEGANNNTNNN